MHPTKRRETETINTCNEVYTPGVPLSRVFQNQLHSKGLLVVVDGGDLKKRGQE